MVDGNLFIPEGNKAFFGSQWCQDANTLRAAIAIFGIKYGYTYWDNGFAYDNSEAPDAIRSASYNAFFHLDRYDFDFDGTLRQEWDIGLNDLGNVKGSPDRPAEIFERAERLTRTLVENLNVPILLGGDHSVSIPVIRGLERHGNVVLVQVDAHADWRDEVDGQRFGQSSTIRRASEMKHISEIYQIGMRAQGSMRPADFADAIAYGAHFIKADHVHDFGVEAVLKEVPIGRKVYITIDADGLDPSVMPAVYSPTPGGLFFHQVARIVRHLASTSEIVGMDIVEVAPRLDVNSVSSLTAARLIGNVIGGIARNEAFHGHLRRR